MIENPRVGQRVWWCETGTVVEVPGLSGIVVVEDGNGDQFVWTTDQFFESREDAVSSFAQSHTQKVSK